MNIIYAHITDEKLPVKEELNPDSWTYNGLPQHAKYSIAQIEHFNDTAHIVNDDYVYAQTIDIFNMCKNKWPSYYTNSFWFVTLLRLYIVYDYAVQNNITKFVHMEYDNMTYGSCDHLNVLPDGIYFTKVGPQCGSAGFMYCNNLNYYKLFLDRLTNILNQGEERIKKFTQYNHISEMIMIDLIEKNTPQIQYLPLLPSDRYYNILHRVYDGASYGQFLGGTNNGHEEGWSGDHHYIGQEIKNNNIERISIIDNIGHLQPIVEYRQYITNIFNLHIHSKKLERFITK